MKSKIAQILSYRFFKKFWLWTWFTPTNQLWKFHHRLYGRFSSNPRSKTSFYNLGRELNCACPLFKRALMWRHVSRARKQGQIRALLPNVHQFFLPYFFGPRLGYMFERSWKLSLHIPKKFNAFQLLKWFSSLLEVNCVIFARTTNTNVWQTTQF